MRDAVVGVVFFVAMGLLGYFTIIVNDTSLGGFLGKGKDESVVYTAHFDSVAGLELGSKVKTNGMEVGEVTWISQLANGRIQVDIKSTKTIPIRADDYRVLIKDVSPLGGKYVDIETGSTGANLPLGTTLSGSARLGLLEEGGKFVDDIREDVKKTLAEIEATFANLREITDQIKTGEGTIGRLYKDAKLYDELLGTVKDLREFSQKLNDPNGTIGKLLSSDELHTNLNSAVKRIDELVAGVQDGKGTAGKLFNDTALYDEVKALATDLREALKGPGTLGKLVNDPSLYDNLNAAVIDARSIIADARAGKGTIGKLLNDETMYESLKNAIGNIEAISTKLSDPKGSGTLGKLINDDALYNELKKVIGELGKSIEDTREQAPITTFTSVIFSAF